MILNDIITRKRQDLEELKRRFPFHRLKNAVQEKKSFDRRSFAKAISSSRKLNLICEIKKASPSEGILREDFQPLRIAGMYEYAGAAAISVLTETHFFKGRPSYLKTIRQVSKLPVLRKDFILESYQLYESALLDADAYLLIASILTEKELKDLIELGEQLKMDALVEVHTDEDLKKAVIAGASIIGINNRDLKTLTVDPDRAKRLLPHVPKKAIVVIESGIDSHEQIMGYKSQGVHAFLIGTSIMKSENMIAKIQNLLGKDKKWKKEGTSL